MLSSFVSINPCDVCGSEGDGGHYGAYVCRSCAAFFRRAESTGKAYQCRFQNSCIMQSGTSRNCKSCRYAKCISVGMSTDVMAQRRVISKVVSSMNSTKSTPILTRMNYHFNYFEYIRRIDCPKITLFQNFFLTFECLEGGYDCVKRDSSTIMHFSNGDYIDFNNPMHLFDNRERQSADNTAELFRSSCKIYQRNVVQPMCDHKVTRFEFLYLSAMVLWDRGVPGQTKETEAVAVKLRHQLTKELMIHYDQCMPNEQPTMRMASLLMIIPNVQRMVQRCHVDLEMSSIFQLFSLEKEYFDFVQGR